MMKKGDIVLCQFPFTDGSDKKLRPALVISGADINSTQDVILVQITSSGVEDQYCVPISKEELITPIDKISIVRCNKIFVAHQNLIAKTVSSVKTSLYVKVEDKICSIIRNP